MAYFTTDDNVKLYYEVSGEGERTVLLVHGYSMNAAGWDPIMPGLEKHYRVVRFDLRGHGRSETPDYGFSMERCAQDVRNLEELLDLKDYVLVGMSMGGFVTYAYLKLYGDGNLYKFINMVSAPNCVSSENRPYGMMDTAVFLDSLMKVNQDFSTYYGPVNPACFYDPVKAADALAQWNEVCANAVTASMTRFWVSLYTVEYWDVLPSISVPTLYMAGEKDIYPSEAQYEQAKLVQNGRAFIIEKAGHDIMGDQPEIVTNEMIAFIG